MKHLILLSAGLTSQFSIKVRKLYRICHTIFSSFYRICHFNYMLVICGCSVISSSLWHILRCVTCFGVTLSIGSCFLFIIIISIRVLLLPRFNLMISFPAKMLYQEVIENFLRPSEKSGKMKVEKSGHPVLQNASKYFELY